MAREVRNNIAKSRFEMELDGGMAVLDYRISGGVLTLTHTGVPSEFEGHGYGAALVKGALDRIRAQGKKIVVRCSFVDAFIARHPEYEALRR